MEVGGIVIVMGNVSCLEREVAEDADEEGETSPSPRRSSSSAEDEYSGDGS